MRHRGPRLLRHGRGRLLPRDGRTLRERDGHRGVVRRRRGGPPRRGRLERGSEVGARVRSLDRGRPIGRRPALEERLELADRSERSRRRARAPKKVAARHLLREDGALELAQGHEGELLPARGLDEPAVTPRVPPLLATDLELMSAVRAAYGGPAGADERVIELILGFAPLALNVHRRVAHGARMRGDCSPLGRGRAGIAGLSLWGKTLTRAFERCRFACMWARHSLTVPS